ncbi:MAG: hypothetical protein M8858_08150 [marine benthic group bacterium]|nr:hypothetical protein [Gemmatimonadota bacterium]
MAGTPIPNMFLGRKDTLAEVFQWSDGATDGSNGGAGDTIVGLAKSVRWAPAGVGGEAIFTRMWIALTYDMDAVTLRFTPILDGVPQDGTGGTPDLRQSLALTGSVGTRVTERYEFTLYYPYDDGVDSDALRVALRGCWFQLLVETTTTLGDGTLIIEQPEIEYEIVRESLEAE